jgi:hypothetical protein
MPGWSCVLHLFNSPTEIQLSLKILFTLVVCFILAVNWKQYGPANFLWFSDIALVLTVLALWLESSLLASMMALAIVLLDVLWNIDFLVGLVVGRSLTGLTSYMFDRKILRRMRAVSLFHVWLPILLLWIVARLGYDSRAFAAQTLLAWILLPITYLLTERKDNINWVYGLGEKPQQRLPPLVYLALLMIGFPFVVYLPAHLLLRWLF